MRTLMSLVAVAVMSALMGCCHDTCDTCREVCNSCGNNSAGHIHAAPATQSMPAPAK
ncbi:MAG: hypothetical protein U0796_05695 [Gemmatales bacterium]